MIRSLPALSLALLVALTGCVTTPPRPAIAYTGDPVVDGNAARAVAPSQDQALWNYRVGAAALRRGLIAEARERLDAGLTLAHAATSGQNVEAARSRRLFSAEATKPFVGEPYERVMANFYRGIVYWQVGEPGNARALFRNGLFLDSDPGNNIPTGDWALLEYLDGFLTERFGGDGDAALERARQQAGRELPPYNLAANVMVFVEYGHGPRKYAGGEAGEQLRFITKPSKIASARLTVGGKTWDLSPYDDLHYQATTRGGRVMDYVLGNKAVFRSGANEFGDVALVGAAATAHLGRGEDKDKAALALAAVGILSKIASAATQAQADTRTWDNLPQYLSFAALDLPPGEHPAHLSFFAADGQPVPTKTQIFTITVPEVDPTSIASREADRDVIVFRSELTN